MSNTSYLYYVAQSKCYTSYNVLSPFGALNLIKYIKNNENKLFKVKLHHKSLKKVISLEYYFNQNNRPKIFKKIKRSFIIYIYIYIYTNLITCVLCVDETFFLFIYFRFSKIMFKSKIEIIS